MHLDTRFLEGAKVYPELIQIERPGEPDGTVIPWNENQIDLAEKLARELDLNVLRPSTVIKKMENDTLYNTIEDETTVYRKIAGVSKDENIFLNGIVVGKSTSSEVTLVAERWDIKKYYWWRN